MALIKQKKKIVAFRVIALILLILFGALLFSGGIFRPSDWSRPPLRPMPIESRIEFDFSEGLNSSILVGAGSNETLFVLSPGGIGTLPLIVSSTADENLNVSLSPHLDQNANLSGVRLSILPTNFELGPKQQTKSILTVTADKDAAAVLYRDPKVAMQTDPFYTYEKTVFVPSLLVANFTPSCVYLLSDQEFISPVASPTPEQASEINKLSIVPTINLMHGEKTMFLFGCPANESFILNASAPAGFRTEFSPTPLNIIFNWSSGGEMYALEVAADTDVSPGTYKVNFTGSLGSHQFEGSFYISAT
jgi:hypothetical protein